MHADRWFPGYPLYLRTTHSEKIRTALLDRFETAHLEIPALALRVNVDASRIRWPQSCPREDGVQRNQLTGGEACILEIEQRIGERILLRSRGRPSLRA